MGYKHGTYGNLEASKVKSSAVAETVVVYVGTAPINLIKGYASAGLVNVPIKIANMLNAKAKIGNAADWDKFTLCEALAAHFDNTVANVGPIYVINVLDPDIHRKGSDTTKTVAFSAGRGEFASETVILDTLAIANKVEGIDYEVGYNFNAGKVVITSLKDNDRLEGDITVSYREVDTSLIGADDIIGERTSGGQFSGLAAISLIYQRENVVPNVIAAPGWSHIPSVYIAMISARSKINGHWDAYVTADIPLSDEVSNTVKFSGDGEQTSFTISAKPSAIASVKVGDTTLETTAYSYAPSTGILTFTSAPASGTNNIEVSYNSVANIDTLEEAYRWKAAKGYTSEFSDVCWPMIKDGSGRRFHLSTVDAVTMQRVDATHNGVPFESASNKEIMATGQYFGENSSNAGYDQQDANKLNEKGITTAVFWAGRWVLWGPHTAAFNEGSDMDARGVFDSTIRMLMHCTNGFQLRNGTRIDAPLNVNERDNIINSEQEILDSYVGMGALIGTPTVLFVESENPVSELVNGDFVWNIAVTPTVPFKSGTAGVTYTDEGFAAYFGGEG